jgi:hypothetical protein
VKDEILGNVSRHIRGSISKAINADCKRMKRKRQRASNFERRGSCTYSKRLAVIKLAIWKKKGYRS